MNAPAFIAISAFILIAAGPPQDMSAAPGAWEIRLPGEPVRTVCASGDGDLVQLGHRGAICPSRKLGNDRNDVTYRYECAGSGWGQTRLRFATPAAARIDTQGIASGAPFAYVAEARRIGACRQPAR